MEDAAYDIMSELHQNHWWFQSRLSIIQSVLRSLNIHRNSEILEIGCGPGVNIKTLSEFGTIYAADMHESALHYTRQLGIAQDVQQGELPDIPAFPDKKFDLIALFDVLEHIDRDTESLHTLKTQLKENGKILLTVPAFPFLWSGHDLFSHHKRRYTAKSLRKVLDQAGLTISYLSYFNFFLFPIVLAERKLNKLILFLKGQKETAKSDLSPVSPMLNRILRSIFSAEKYFIPRFHFPFGVSIIAICETKK